MFATFKTLIAGASARADEQVKEQYSIELIDQKIREASASLKAAKFALANLVQRANALSSAKSVRLKRALQI